MALSKDYFLYLPNEEDEDGEYLHVLNIDKNKTVKVKNFVIEDSKQFFIDNF